MKRTDVLQAIKGAGAEGNQPLFLRLYTEHRIAYPKAIAAYRDGVSFAKRLASRHVDA